MVICYYQWLSMVLVFFIHGFQWLSMVSVVIHGSVIVHDYQWLWLSVVIHGFVWFIHGYL